MYGSGPTSGVISVFPEVKSVKALENYFPNTLDNTGIEYVYDPEQNIFAVGKVNNASELGITGSPHQQLARAINANEETVLGGTFLGGVGAAFGGMGKLAEFGLALRAARKVGGGAEDFSIAGKYSVQYRTTRMLEKNVGYNVTPENVFSEFSQVGKNGTYVTDYQAIAEIIGPVRANTKIDIGLFTTRAQGRLSYFKVLRLERALGLKPGSLVKDSFRFSRITEITERHPRSPIDGNRFFQGAGKGLPGGGPELVIDSLPTNPWP